MEFPTVVVCLVWFFSGILASAQLTTSFYKTTCSGKSAVDHFKTEGEEKAVANEENAWGLPCFGFIFHDCFVNGCDASGSIRRHCQLHRKRKTAQPNNGSLRGFDVVDTIKSKVESVCPGVVPCADILAVAARDSVVALGGKSWGVLLGRRDSTTASLSAANTGIPAPTLNLSGLITSFSNVGLSTKDLVVLSGAHTIGQARCTSFRARIYNETNINSSFAKSLQANCPSTGGDNNLSPLDTSSPTTFDVGYYTDLIGQKGLLHSDQQLYNGGSTDSQVTSYSSSSSTFLTDFGTSMINMGNISPLTGSRGQVRTNCRKTN
uniref:Peroxidase n=1 Tax=Tamarix hispida TaxID=189793 RepID=C0KKI0_9CARY|nr:class III peroxidase [Tamarix hispida]